MLVGAQLLQRKNITVLIPRGYEHLPDLQDFPWRQVAVAGINAPPNFCLKRLQVSHSSSSAANGPLHPAQTIRANKTDFQVNQTQANLTKHQMPTPSFHWHVSWQRRNLLELLFQAGLYDFTEMAKQELRLRNE